MEWAQTSWCFPRQSRSHRTTAKELVEVVPPRIEALCPIGAGDALAAAFTWAMDKKR